MSEEKSPVTQSVTQAEKKMTPHQKTSESASKNTFIPKTPEIILQEAYQRTERLLHINTRKLQEGIKPLEDGEESIELAARDLRILLQNFQDLQQDLKLYAEALQSEAQQNSATQKQNNDTNAILTALFGDMPGTVSFQDSSRNPGASMRQAIDREYELETDD
jgi:hypothetical protein